MHRTIFLFFLLQLCANVHTLAVESSLQTENVAVPQYQDALTTFDGTFGSRWYPATSEARERFIDASAPQLVLDKDGTGTFILVTDSNHHVEVYIKFQWRLEGNSLIIVIPNAVPGEQAIPVKSGTYTISIQRVVKGLPALDANPEIAQAFYLLTFDKSPVASSDDEYYKQWLRPIELKDSKD